LQAATILGYKSVIVTLVHPQAQQQLTSSALLSRYLRGIQSARPAVRPPPVWCRETLLIKLEATPLDKSSMFAVGQQLALLLLLFGGRRVHDLTLLHTAPGDMVLSKKRVVFQPRLGSKTDLKGRSNFVQSKMGFKNQSNWKLSVPALTQEYLTLSKSVRAGHSALLLSARPPHRPASTSALRIWVRRALERHGIVASAGSTRSAAATSAGLAGCSIDAVMKNGNWRSRATLARHYFRPPTTS